jgi:hypothetical protein
VGCAAAVVELALATPARQVVPMMCGASLLLSLVCCIMCEQQWQESTVVGVARRARAAIPAALCAT